MPQQIFTSDICQQWVIGPDGGKMTRDDLPAAGERWTAFRKAAVVSALNGGLVSIAEMLGTYGLTIEELSAWQRGFNHFGIAGLRQTYTQRTRDRIIRDIRYS
ncbi:MAG: DUF1153 domain-containing protein [Sphingobium sp.]